MNQYRSERKRDALVIIIITITIIIIIIMMMMMMTMTKGCEGNFAEHWVTRVNDDRAVETQPHYIRFAGNFNFHIYLVI